MDEKNKTFPLMAFVVVVMLFLIFGGGMMSGWNGSGMMGGGGFMTAGNAGGGRIDGWTMGGFSWMWFPTLLFLGLGILFGWTIWGKK